MSVTVELPDDALARLQAEAARRGVSIDVVIAELATRLPAETPPAMTTSRKLSFASVGASGAAEPVGRRHREIIAEHFADKTARDV